MCAPRYAFATHIPLPSVTTAHACASNVLCSMLQSSSLCCCCCLQSSCMACGCTCIKCVLHGLQTASTLSWCSNALLGTSCVIQLHIQAKLDRLHLSTQTLPSCFHVWCILSARAQQDLYYCTQVSERKQCYFYISADDSRYDCAQATSATRAS